jgi:hypothetical protein
LAASSRASAISIGELLGPGMIGLGREHAELVAAESGDGVLGAHRMGECLRDVAQEVVAGAVAEAIVERLEAVEVDHDERERTLHTAVARDLMVGLGEQRPAVGDPGEGVGEGEVTQVVALALDPRACRLSDRRRRERHAQRRPRRGTVTGPRERRRTGGDHRRHDRQRTRPGA